MVGQTISHYRILDKLGEGGMGVVYKAEDLKLKRTVALKFLAERALADPTARARLTREAQAAGSLDHPNICHVYDLVEAEGHMFIAMACVEGRSLAQMIREGITLGQALDIAVQTGEGLRAAHSRGIIHRDVKAANILVNREGAAKITDFGVARIEDRSRITKPGTVMGTVVCMAPEQLLAEDADSRTDIWAFGVMLYEMCTGRLPFQRRDFERSTRAILHEEPAKPSSILSALPAELDWILGKALAKRREERYQHIDDLVVDLRAMAKGLSEGQRAISVGAAASGEATTEAVERKTWLSRIFRGARE